MGLLIPCSKELVGSNPTPRALLRDSSRKLISYDMRIFLTIILALQEIPLEDICNELVTKIESITQYNSKPYFRQALKRLAAINAENANVVCDYILA